MGMENVGAKYFKNSLCKLSNVNWTTCVKRPFTAGTDVFGLTFIAVKSDITFSRCFRQVSGSGHINDRKVTIFRCMFTITRY